MTLLSLGILLSVQTASAFCGFYVGKADATIFNEASQVIVAHKENRTVISMLNDFKGEMKDFAMVVPVPSVLEKGQIHIGEKSTFDRLDAFSAPRLVEYFDQDPCNPVVYEAVQAMNAPASFGGAGGGGMPGPQKEYKVTVEASYTIGEYDIVILSAEESDGLERWLIDNKYKIPAGAAAALKPYINQKMKFFVAKVNIKEQMKSGFNFLRPIQFAFESEKFMLPLRLGMINAKGPQDLIIYMLSTTGRVETTNYRTIKLPADKTIPEYTKDDFKNFYTSMFKEQTKKEDSKVVFTEYFWDMSWCDPCAADPLTQEELKKAGVFWLNENQNGSITPSANNNSFVPQTPGTSTMIWPRRGGQTPSTTKITRLHVRYTPEKFPEDLMFQETQDNQNFQGRFILQHPFKGATCEAAKPYYQSLAKRQEQEAQTLASLTGWDISEIRKKLKLEQPKGSSKKWWNDIWK